MSNVAPEAIKPREAGLALSGGGFRATLFHLGALWRMNELGQLNHVNRITSVSGGSIVAGYLGYRWHELNFIQGVATNFSELIAEPIERFCSETYDVGAIAKGKLNPFRTAADYMAAAYDEHLFRGATLTSLPNDNQGDGPRFIIYATNMQSGVSFRFSRPYLADYRIGINRNTSGIRLADAVAASSAFPPIMTPKILSTDPSDWEQDADPRKRGDLWEHERFRSKIYLSDGGVYDNMGLETVFDRCDPVFVGAAGAPFSSEPMKWTATKTEVGVALRTTSIMTEQVRALRRRMLISRYTKDGIGGCYWNISSTIARYGLADPIVSDSGITDAQRFIRTRLNAFSDQEQGHLINWGYVIADTAIRRWGVPQPLGTWAWPKPAYPIP